MNNIVLIGMPGSGKSTVGALLAKRLHYQYVDTDSILVEQSGKSLSKLLDTKGLDGFLALEAQVGEALQCEYSVVAAGGSMVLNSAAMKNIADHSVVVWLDTDLNELIRRIGSDANRVMAVEKGTTVGVMYGKRRPLYRKYADIRIHGNDVAESVVNHIMDALIQHGYVG